MQVYEIIKQKSFQHKAKNIWKIKLCYLLLLNVQSARDILTQCGNANIIGATNLALSWTKVTSEITNVNYYLSFPSILALACLTKPSFHSIVVFFYLHIS